MAFLIDPQELKPGLILFRRADVQHRDSYCRIKVPGSDRYKTVSLRTADVTTAREAAFDAHADLRFRVKHDVPVFNGPLLRSRRCTPTIRWPAQRPERSPTIAGR